MTKKKHDAEDDVELTNISIEEEPSTPEKTENTEPEVEVSHHSDSEGLKPAKQPFFKRLFATKKRKIIAGILAVLIVLGGLYAFPTTRYGILGTVLKKNVTITITDSTTNKPITSATVELSGKSVTTTEKGQAAFTNVPVGEYTVKITKKYYKDNSFSYTVPVFGNPEQPSVSVVATGRQVPIKVTNLVTKAVLSKASIAVGDSSAITDEKGMATVVLPADKTTLNGTVSLSGYNDAKVAITVTEQADKNNFALTPSGTIYYLSNASGTIDVMKANLDGTNVQVAVKGTGNEDSFNTTVLSTRDWKYVAIRAHRNASAGDQLYLLNTQTSALTLMDQANDAHANFSLIGWANHRFVYAVSRDNVSDWQAGRQALKSYDADASKLLTIDQTAAVGTNYYDAAYEQLNSFEMIGDTVIYSKGWYANSYQYPPLNQKAAIMSINADGSKKTRMKEFSVNKASYIESKMYAPKGIYFRLWIDNGPAVYYAYDNGNLQSSSINDTRYNNTQNISYLASPSANRLFWQDYRDGKNSLFIGDTNANNAQTIATLSDYSSYGWFSDDYVLLSKNNSELYIASSSVPISDTDMPVKITNYFRARYTSNDGYGGM